MFFEVGIEKSDTKGIGEVSSIDQNGEVKERVVLENNINE